MQRFKSPGSAQRFLSAHAAVFNIFNVNRHLTSVPTPRAFRAAAMNTWREAVAAACNLKSRRPFALFRRQRDKPAYSSLLRSRRQRVHVDIAQALHRRPRLCHQGSGGDEPTMIGTRLSRDLAAFEVR